MGIITKINAGGTDHLIASSAYGTCTTAAGTAAKVVTLSNFDTLTAGVTIHVRFTNSNTAANPTLNVNSKGAKNIYAYGTTAPGTTVSTSWQAGAVVSFTYNTDNNSNGCWVMNNYIADTNTDTDTKVTSSANHYTPSTASGNDKTASASGATAAWSIDVVKGITINTDGKGHITGLSVTSGKIPANPNTDTDTKNTAGSSNKTGTKMYLIAATEQSTNPVTYSNSNCYIGTDNCLYSGGTKVLTAHQTAVTSLTTTAGAHTTKTSATGAVSIAIPTKTSHLTNDSGFITSYTDTKNTAGSTNISSKIFLIGATSQAASPQTYSHDTAYVGTDGYLYSGGYKTLTTTDATTTGEAGKIMQSVSDTGALTIGTSLFFTRVNTNYLQIPNFQVDSNNFLNYYATGHKFDTSVYIEGHDYPIGYYYEAAIGEKSVTAGADWTTILTLEVSPGSYILSGSVYFPSTGADHRIAMRLYNTTGDSVYLASRTICDTGNVSANSINGTTPLLTGSTITVALQCWFTATSGTTVKVNGYIRGMRIA